MARTASFRLNRSGLLLALISAAFAGPAGAAAGRVDFAVGSATVVGTDGRSRPVARGTELDTGDTVRTQEGRVQVRMTDGAFISLQPNTEFGIKNYRFEGKTDGTEAAFYSLVRGAMRTVTGLIGRVNRNKYLVSTPTATVGIRGTGGLIQILPDGSTLVQGTSGIWFLANPSGSIDIPAGVSGLAPADPKQPPQETSVAPTAGPTPPIDQKGYVQGDQTTSTGEPVIGDPLITPVLLSGSGYAATLVFGVSGNSPQMSSDFNATATFDAAGRMTAVPNLQSQFYNQGAGGAHADFGTDGILAWGRWIGPVTGDWTGTGSVLSEDYNANQGLHYVIGIPTPSMPQSGQATYTLLGATQPTYFDGRTSPGTFSGSLSVIFGATALIDANFTVAMPDQTYGMNAKSAPTSTALFSFSPTVTGCTSTCSGSVQGFFAGANAERAGLGYQINDIGKNVIGAAAFKKQ